MSDASELYHQATRAIDAGDFDGAESLLHQSLKVSLHFKTFERLGEIAFARGDLVKAITYLAAAIGYGNRQTKARLLLAKSLLKLDSSREREDARRLLKEAIEINPDYKPARDLLETLPPEPSND